MCSSDLKWAARAESALGTTAISPKYGTVEGGEAAPAAPAAKVDPIQFNDFRQNYTELRNEYLDLAGKTRPTDADMRKMKLIQRDFAEVLNQNADLLGNDKQLIEQLQNPMFDGTRVIDALGNQMLSLASQGELIPTAKAVNRKIMTALTLANQIGRAHV